MQTCPCNPMQILTITCLDVWPLLNLQGLASTCSKFQHAQIRVQVHASHCRFFSVWPANASWCKSLHKSADQISQSMLPLCAQFGLELADAFKLASTCIYCFERLHASLLLQLQVTASQNLHHWTCIHVWSGLYNGHVTILLSPRHSMQLTPCVHTERHLLVSAS